MTETNNMENIISQNEKELSLIFENAPVIMIVINNERRIKRINKFGIDNTNKSIDEIINRRPGEIINCIHSINNEGGCGFGDYCKKCEARNYVLKTIETGETFFKKEIEFKVDNNDKIQQLFFNLSTAIIDNENQKLYLISLDDITKTKTYERALMYSEEAFKLIFESNSNFVFKVDLNGTISDCNHQVKNLIGFEKYEIIGKHLTKIIDDANSEFIHNNMDRIIYDGILDNLEVSLKTKNSEKIDVLIESVLLTSENNEETGRIFIINDVTDFKIMNQKLIESEERLHQLTQHIERVREEEKKRIAEVIHDGIGQSLTALKLNMRLLNDEIIDKKDKFDEYFDEVISLVDDTIHKVRNISTELRPAILDHLGLVHAIYWQLEEFEKLTKIPNEFVHEPKNIKIDISISTIIFRILQESLTNIARHANASWVEIVLKKTDDLLYFSISDNGVGITVEQSNDPKSFGIMAIRERVLSLKGTIDIYGKKSEGTTLIMEIPIN